MTSNPFADPQARPRAQAREGLVSASPAATAPHARRFTTEELFADLQEIEIVHGNIRYRMRRTSSGKLILTK